jgi:hypothetical protein
MATTATPAPHFQAANFPNTLSRKISHALHAAEISVALAGLYACALALAHGVDAPIVAGAIIYWAASRFLLR